MKIWFFCLALFNLFCLSSCIDDGDNARAGRPLVRNLAEAPEPPPPTPEPTATPAPPKRPTDDIVINNDFCACNSGKNVLNNNCNNFCANSGDKETTLHGNVRIGPEVELFDGLGNLENWCGVELEPGVVPTCFFLVESENSTEQLNVTVAGNSFTVNIQNLQKKIRYKAKLIVSGEAEGYLPQTSSIQLYLVDDSTDDDKDGPLEISSMGRYACFNRKTKQNTANGTIVFEDVIRQHFFLAQNGSPPTLPACTTVLVCHDPEEFGKYDSPLAPRLEYEPLAFRVWSHHDLRTYETTTKGKLNINLYIQEKLKEVYGQNSTINIFRNFKWSGGPDVTQNLCLNVSTSNDSTSSSSSSSSKTSGLSLVGIIMQPWVREDNNKISFCPTQNDYNSGKPVFELLKEIVGVDTEGLFAALREPVSYTNQEGQKVYDASLKDVILISESLLNKIWFHYENGKFLEPTVITAGQKPVMFYWPITDESVDTPYQKKSFQRLYSIKSSKEINSEEEDRTQINAKDKRVGCIPASAN